MHQQNGLLVHHDIPESLPKEELPLTTKPLAKRMLNCYSIYSGVAGHTIDWNCWTCRDGRVGEDTGRRLQGGPGAAVQRGPLRAAGGGQSRTPG